MTSLLFLKVKSAKALKTDKPEHPILKAIIENIQTDRQTSKAIEVTTPQE